MGKEKKDYSGCLEIFFGLLELTFEILCSVLESGGG